MNWVLCLWLAYSPTTLTPLAWTADKEACLRVQQHDVQSSVSSGMGGGATYLCLPGTSCMKPDEPTRYIPVVTTRAMLEAK